jgi:hypothetical protein
MRMTTSKRITAFLELILLCPGTLFMTALVVRNLQPATSEPAQTARFLVAWYSSRLVLGLYIFLLAMPLTAFMVGSLAVVGGWRSDREDHGFPRRVFAALGKDLATTVIAAATVAAAIILVIVVAHVMMN